jgi:hypothetical protein
MADLQDSAQLAMPIQAVNPTVRTRLLLCPVLLAALTAEAGASLAELMQRMGHSSARAAMVYLHARDERHQQLASSLDRMARRELKRSRRRPADSGPGTERARRDSEGPGEGPADGAEKAV